MSQLVDGNGKRLRFVRFNVVFNRNAAGPPALLSFASPRPRVTLLKLPFQFH